MNQPDPAEIEAIVGVLQRRIDTAGVRVSDDEENLPDQPTVIGWEPLRVDQAGNCWEWSFRDGAGTRIIVGPAEKAYVEHLQTEVARLTAWCEHDESKLSTTEAALAESREQYAKLVEHHRQCELAGTELCEAANEAVIYSADGPSRDRLNAAMMTWDAHQWPEIMNAEMGDEQ